MKTNGELKILFADYAHEKGLTLDMYFDDRENPYIDEETKYCFEVFCQVHTVIEKDIAESQETRIKELASMGEFESPGDAIDYCRLHGLSFESVDGNFFSIAGALMDARKDQDKIAWNALNTVLSDVEYHSEAMGCGLEDLNITDRYEAMEYGFNEAIRMVNEVTLNEKPV